MFQNHGKSQNLRFEQSRDPENRISHTFKKSLSFEESLKRIKKNKKNEKMSFFVFVIDFRGRGPGHLR